MQLIRGYKQHHKQTRSASANDVSVKTSQCVATIGNFDGVHVGHQKIIHRVTQMAKQMGLASCVIVFEPHPKEYFLKQKSPPRLTRLRQKYLQLKKLGVDRLLVLAFNEQLSQMKAPDFIQHILVEAMQVKHLVVGDDFHFGYQRQGDFELLKQLGQGRFTIEPTQTIYLDRSEKQHAAIRVSSTRIRQALAENDFLMADKLLGRRFSLCGKVHYGRQLGRTIGFPTANIALQRKKFPLAGVYWGRAKWQQPQSAEIQTAWAVANCGVRPTVDGNNFKLEVHLLGMTAELYGIELAFEFFGFLRAEQKFDGIDALTAQITRDVEQAKGFIQSFENQ